VQGFYSFDLLCIHFVYRLQLLMTSALTLFVRWLGIRKRIQPVKLSDEVLVWLSGVSADCIVQLMPLHPQTPSSLASFKSRMVLPFSPFWYWLTQVVVEKRPLNGLVVLVVLYMHV